MLRLLVDDITVERNEGSNVTLHVRWSGGACDDIAIVLPNPGPIADRFRYPQERIDEVRQLATSHSDYAIADEFNRSGKLSSKGRPFTKSMIAWIRFKHKIPAPNLKRPGELTVREVADRFGVTLSVVYYWIEHQIVTTRQTRPGRPHWIRITCEKQRELAEWVQCSTKIKKTTNAH